MIAEICLSISCLILYCKPTQLALSATYFTEHGFTLQENIKLQPSSISQSSYQEDHFQVTTQQPHLVMKMDFCSQISITWKTAEDSQLYATTLIFISPFSNGTRFFIQRAAPQSMFVLLFLTSALFQLKDFPQCNQLIHPFSFLGNCWRHTTNIIKSVINKNLSAFSRHFMLH